MNTRTHRRRHAGFSLIEIMVAMVIGMVAVIIMTQVLMQSEGAKRNTISGDDAQINASIALSNLERDIRMSGFGLNAYNLLGCTLTLRPRNESANTSALTIAPATINPATTLVPAGDANTDTLLVMYGNGSSPAEGDAVISASGTSYKVTTPTSFTTDDRVITLPLPRTTNCALTTDRVTNVPGDGSISVAAGLSGIKTGDIVYNLGKQPIIRAYAVRQGNLTVCDYTAYNCGKASYTTTLNSNVWVPISSNVVSLRAQYGHDQSTTPPAAMTGVVTTFNQTTPSSSTFPACEWARMLSVRLAVVARGGQYDANKNKDGDITVVTADAPKWAASTDVPIDLSGLSDWQQYRYKTVETSVPLRNMIWQGGQAGYLGGDGGC